ncbi:MAG: hypothetical protein LBK76_03615 [Verrucomicrobiales bacterium]|jgi:hypothetical protein|nr:hypothetical protein [Verrucomicrobiales bacterium]
MFELKKLRPIKIDDLTRYGRDFDGGYVIPRRCVAQTQALLSFGVNDDWSFEKDFLQASGGQLFAYDWSAGPELFSKRRRLNLARLPWYLMQRKPAGGLVRQIIADTRLQKDFWRFFDGQRRVFVKKFIGYAEDEQFTTFDTVFKNLGTIPQHSIFVKMDIENWEYRTLPSLAPWLSYVNGLVVEFHELDICREAFERVVDLLLRDFYIAHVHGNVSGGWTRGAKVPRVLELSFINKALLAGQTVEPTTLTYPVPGLDFSCEKGGADLPLDFS